MHLLTKKNITDIVGMSLLDWDLKCYGVIVHQTQRFQDIFGSVYSLGTDN